VGVSYITGSGDNFATGAAAAAGVAQAAVVVSGRSRRGVGLLAICALGRPGMTDDDAIMAHCRSILPARAVPDRLEIIETMPMLPTGKVDRQALAEMAQKLSDAPGSGG